MKLYEVTIRGSAEPLHAYWIKSRGPEDIGGMSLHYIQDSEKWNEQLRKEAAAKGDERWLQNIEQKAEREAKAGQKFFTPQIGWWMSQDDYEAGKEGFGGVTKEKVEAKYPQITIHNDRSEAAKAAGF